MNEDELRRETERMLALRVGVQQELRGIPGVIGVGVGVRERAGRATGELAFRVYTELKRPRSSLRSSDVLPLRIRDCPVDVHTIGKGYPECCGATRPLLGGLSLSPEPFSTFQIELGTLGCFLTLPDGREVGLSNEHVLLSDGARDPRIFQPEYKSVLGFTCNLIGASLGALAHDGDFTFDGEPHYIDCAVVDFEGVDFVNRLVRIENSTEGEETVAVSGVAGSVKRNAAGKVTQLSDGSGAVVNLRRIAGSAQAVPGTLIFKVGGTTGITVGQVMDVAAPLVLHRGRDPFQAPQQIIVKPVAGYRLKSNVEAFSEHGDSGSVYMNLENQVVGLHHHRGTNDAGVVESYGSNIAPVLRRLGDGQASATVIDTDSDVARATAAASTELARSLWLDAPAEAHRLDALEPILREALARTARGRRLLALMEKHLPEILLLVWNRRAVTAAWHRAHGPAFVVLFARALTRSGAPFPTEAGGISRRALLASMADVLARHGSPSLRADLADVRPWLLELLAECGSVADLCDRLAELAA